MQKELMRYIPREYKKLVTNIYLGERVWDDESHRWDTRLVVEWENGEVSEFQNRTFAWHCLKEVHMPDEYRNA